MATRQEIKERSKDQLGRKLFGNRWIMMLLALLIYDLLLGLVSGTMPFNPQDGWAISAGKTIVNIGASILFFVLTGPLTYGITRVMTKAARNDEQADLNELFTGFTECASDAIILGLLRSIFIFLWTLLLIVPGIIKAYAYSMSSYIQQDDKNKDWKYCLNKSQEIMKGHKWDLFVLDLSFIGWYIVGLLCFGIGVLWVEPYHQMARTNFYLELVKDSEPQEEEDGEIIEGEITEKEASVFDE